MIIFNGCSLSAPTNQTLPVEGVTAKNGYIEVLINTVPLSFCESLAALLSLVGNFLIFLLEYIFQTYWAVRLTKIILEQAILRLSIYDALFILLATAIHKRVLQQRQMARLRLNSIISFAVVVINKFNR